VICTDKTATLTEGKISVSKIFDGQKILNASSRNLINDSIYKIAMVCNEAFIENIQDEKKDWVVRGGPTDRAILLFGLESGISKQAVEQELVKIDELPFDNKKKFLATLHKKGNNNFLFVSGAPENLLAMSNLDESTKKKWEKKLEELTRQGFRVICFAKKKIIQDTIVNSEFKNLEIVSFLGLSDPLRKDAKKSIKICRQAGMKIIMVTGDHRLTAESIAKQLGFKISKKSVIEGGELSALSDEEFKKRVKDIQIYARVEPEHKMRIVRAWQERGEVVAMTGDGINDAPALKQADIGVALGSGTSVAKETSDLVLLNNSFSVIVYAIEEGRAILDNIRKVITYLLTDSFTEVILIGGSMLIAKLYGQVWFLPLTAVQILWINLIEDGPPSIALAFEPKENDLMKMKPRGHKVKLLTKEMKIIIFTIGIITDLMLLGLFAWFCLKGLDIRYIRTMIFAALAIDSLIYVFSCKSLRKGLFHINIFSNKVLIGGWIFGMVALIGAVHLPALNHLLGTIPLHIADWYILASLGIIELLLIEAVKHYFIVRHQTEK
ncbi:HAD-IC family P-type ATPase, partial [Patescibacteria group bacterium]|nr:HAD-IC family P-type ATPase [Patescibacteria group bacterium]